MGYLKLGFVEYFILLRARGQGDFNCGASSQLGWQARTIKATLQGDTTELPQYHLPHAPYIGTLFQDQTPSWVNICGGTYLFSENAEAWSVS